MAKPRQESPAHPCRTRLLSLGVVGSLPLAAALVGIGPTAAQPVQHNPLSAFLVPAAESPMRDAVPARYAAGTALPAPNTPYAANSLVDEEAVNPDAQAPATNATPGHETGPAPEYGAAPAYVDRNSPAGMRTIPDPNKLAPVEVQQLHMPNPQTMAAPVAPIAPPAGKLRAGDLMIDSFLPPEQTSQLNEPVARAEAGLAQTLDSAGFAPTRSDRIAAQTISGAVIGAAVGAAVVAPLGAISGAIGGVCGAVAGIPMLPLGTVAVVMFGAAVGAAMFEAPAMAVGAALGATVGAIAGGVAPATIGADPAIDATAPPAP